ncbi:hypothetical protein SI65_08193 [Aspergillus cristatus]|uniref:Uncharacterized protein n=1 Tax=Aspergillus cristatus TaxID=573508 RepID=A0A1E3B5K2_ASPCR|nr:hypothetical protein SI65_08193 [Aspergillus cristatus]
MAPNANSSKDGNTDLDVSEFGESGSDGTSLSDTTSNYIPSETSEDRAFVVSDSEEQLWLTSDDEILGRWDENQQNKGLRPIKVMARRSVASKDGQITQYLTLWYSWETADKVLDKVGDMVSDLHID